MSALVNKLLLAEDKLISEMNLRQPGLMQSGSFTKSKEKIEKSRGTRDST